MWGGTGGSETPRFAASEKGVPDHQRLKRKQTRFLSDVIKQRTIVKTWIHKLTIPGKGFRNGLTNHQVVRQERTQTNT